MVLADVDIRSRIENGSIGVEPYDETNVEPASLDLTLGDDFVKLVPNMVGEEHSRSVKPYPKPVSLTDDSKSPEDLITHRTIDERPVLIRPGDLLLATTREYVDVPDDLTAQVLGRSSLGRLGVSVHQTAGFIDPGFSGEITLELSNNGPAPVELEEDLRVCQIIFNELSQTAANPYGHEGSNYQDQTGATESSGDFE
jgi:dCTP deaminase